MTRTIPAHAHTAAARGDFALGALSAAGHEIRDAVALDLLDQLNRGEIDFETYKHMVIAHQREQ